MDVETSLIEQMQQDTEEAVGGVSRETAKVVKATITHLLASSSSALFISTFDTYRENLRANAECTDSRRHAQAMLAAQERLEGRFFLKDAWGKALNQWVDTHSEVNDLLEPLDDLCRALPQKKPTKAWLAQLTQLLTTFTEEAVLDTIRTWLQLFIEDDEIKKDGISYANEDKLKAFLWILASKHAEQDAQLFRNLAVQCYAKVPYLGPTSSAGGNLCLQSLSELEGTQGLVHLNELSLTLKYPSNAKTLAEKRLAEVAARKGLSRDDLADLLVPDHGLS
ncbi:MAG: hypothetical protein AAF512_19875 [Pseudomonadota bacterium]